MTIAELFESRIKDPQWNTSYPLNPADWAVYRVADALPFNHDKILSFYIHIPFCMQLCSFCEYTKMLCPNESLQKKYINVIANDIEHFKKQYHNYTLAGFDIGGGTPTALSDTNFAFLMDVFDNAISGQALTDSFEPSVEGTFNTLSDKKLERMIKSGIYRLSLGIQSSCKSVLKNYCRNILQKRNMKMWIQKAENVGIKKINIDLMYGLKGQCARTIDNDIKLIGELQPQQVTLYELRTNMIPIKLIPGEDELFDMYSRYYEGLINLGYYARFGQNTFSKNFGDFGVSSYLRERMLNGTSYKGFGLSAQSMSAEGLSYNMGKGATFNLSTLSADSYHEEYTYILPQKELAAKYMAISAYSGSFSLEILKKFGMEKSNLQDTLSFCLSQGLLYDIGNNRFSVTPKGFKNYGALFSLFSIV